jgi:hypothetical protein
LCETEATDRLKFYARFDKNFSAQQQQIRDMLLVTYCVKNSSFVLGQDIVAKSWNRIKVGKAAGPDGLSSGLLNKVIKAVCS